MLLPVGKPTPHPQPAPYHPPSPHLSQPCLLFSLPPSRAYMHPGRERSITSRLMEPSARTSLGDAPICRVGLQRGKAINVLT